MTGAPLLMVKLPNLAGLEGLLDLDRRGVDIRPILLRVITDQYLLSRTHTPEEERQFTELALRLIGETDIATRAQVAARLASHTCAPRPIVLRLGRDALEVAEPVLRYSPLLTAADLAAIAAERGPAHAAIIASRTNAEGESALAPPSVAVAWTERQRSPGAISLHVTPLSASLPAGRAPGKGGPVMPQSDSASARTAGLVETALVSATEAPASAAEIAHAEASELCELFFAAGPAERRLILINLDYVMWTPAALPLQMQQTDIWRLESAALQHKTDAVVHDLERALAISHQQARRIAEDETGEPTVVAAKAMELPAEVLQRILLFMNPRVGQSVDRVYELAALYGEITTDAARRLLAIWRAADPPDAPLTQHDVAWQEAVDYARAALAGTTRRAPATMRRETLPRPGERAVGADRR